MVPEASSGGPAESSDQRLSYKFQRLRERIRAAIASGELAGKLPGERELAKRFKVNTKTLSKALSELAADGLVERSIGLGTFVRGAGERETIRALLIGGGERAAALTKYVDAAQLQLTQHPDNELPPAAAQKFDCFVFVSDRAGDDAVRDLLLRGRRVITLGFRPATLATWAVMIDVPGAAATLARQLVNRGHRRLMVVGIDPDGEALLTVRGAAGEDTQITHGGLTELSDGLAGGTTGFILLPSVTPKQVTDYFAARSCRVPQDASVVAVNWLDGDPPCTGCYFPLRQAAELVVQMADSQSSARPTAVWINGTLGDAGTLGPAPHRH